MTRLALGLLLLVVAAPLVLAAEPPTEVGQIYVIDANKGFIIAEFPSGRRLINVDQRNLWRYQVGGEIRLDSFGRIQS
jgi:hypothetical protein